MVYQVTNLTDVWVEHKVVNVGGFFKTLCISRNFMCEQMFLIIAHWQAAKISLSKTVLRIVFQVRRADPNILVIQNWITRHLSYNRDGTPKHSQWWMTKVARSLDYLLELSVHSWLFHILRFPMLITHHSEASG